MDPGEWAFLGLFSGVSLRGRTEGRGPKSSAPRPAESVPPGASRAARTPECGRFAAASLHLLVLGVCWASRFTGGLKFRAPGRASHHDRQSRCVNPFCPPAPLSPSRQKCRHPRQECRSSERNSLSRERNALFQGRTALFQERTALFLERNAVFQERTALFQEGTALFKERTALFQGRTALSQGSTALSKGRTALFQGRTALSQERMLLIFDRHRGGFGGLRPFRKAKPEQKLKIYSKFYTPWMASIAACPSEC